MRDYSPRPNWRPENYDQHDREVATAFLAGVMWTLLLCALFWQAVA